MRDGMSLIDGGFGEAPENPCEQVAVPVEPGLLPLQRGCMHVLRLMDVLAIRGHEPEPVTCGVDLCRQNVAIVRSSRLAARA
jgi:hypothetical protein